MPIFREKNNYFGLQFRTFQGCKLLWALPGIGSVNSGFWGAGAAFWTSILEAEGCGTCLGTAHLNGVPYPEGGTLTGSLRQTGASDDLGGDVGCTSDWIYESWLSAYCQGRGPGEWLVIFNTQIAGDECLDDVLVALLGMGPGWALSAQLHCTSVYHHLGVVSQSLYCCSYRTHTCGQAARVHTHHTHTEVTHQTWARVEPGPMST